ncbi:hypothetical protein DdX_10893 [Ditylenchus destructor]|uniref:Uncharacterized protein n=1 Tax=Ditylenchus destructor TaxID=166010 RepID=A0AAD4R1T4_9BILA|nr:hypothetical protein DdX_10893 [Ditylenchus destructor]
MHFPTNAETIDSHVFCRYSAAISGDLDLSRSVWWKRCYYELALIRQQCLWPSRVGPGQRFACESKAKPRILACDPPTTLGIFLIHARSRLGQIENTM